MNKQLIYSILQYKHSPVLREAINIGVLFYFPQETRKLYLNLTDATRLRPIYENFDNRYYNISLKIIQSNIEKYSGDCFAQESLNKNFSNFINDYLLKEDDTVLQFSDPFITINVFSSPEKAVEEYTRLLLPFSTKKESQIIKHDDKFIIKKVKTILSSFSKSYSDSNHLVKDFEIHTEKVDLKFDFGWRNNSLNLICPLSFDLQETQAVQRKTAEYCSYLNWLNPYTKENNCRIDILLGEPQEKKLKDTYFKSIKLLEETESNKKVVPFEEIEEYTKDVAKILI